jgi:CBS domain containing-hemolysin-like protein
MSLNFLDKFTSFMKHFSGSTSNGNNVDDEKTHEAKISELDKEEMWLINNIIRLKNLLHLGQP